MKRSITTFARRVVLASALASGAGAAHASGDAGTFDIDWSTIDGGGGVSGAGDVELAGTIGQAEAGPDMIGGDWALTGGFWALDAGAVDPCPADLDGSGAVDFGDLLAVLSSWGPCGGCPEDLDGSGAVDFPDLLLILSSWGVCP